LEEKGRNGRKGEEQIYMIERGHRGFSTKVGRRGRGEMAFTALRLLLTYVKGGQVPVVFCTRDKLLSIDFPHCAIELFSRQVNSVFTEEKEAEESRCRWLCLSSK
jgi:hypothetical protein